MVAGREERDVVVMVALTLMMEVGRTGAPGGLEEDRVEVEGEVGQLALPQRRSDIQQPPPRLEGHDRKPDEQVRGLGVMVVEGAVVVTAESKEEDEVSEDVGVVVGRVLVEGLAVTVGLTTTVAVELRIPRSSHQLLLLNGGFFASSIHLHPIPSHVYPETQHPPPWLGHPVYPDGQSCTPPEQVSPAGQHPTAPKPLLGLTTYWHVSPFGQQLFGAPTSTQLNVLEGHWKSLLLKLASGDRSNLPKRGFRVSGCSK